jgi:hypothetical protein
MRAVRLLDLPRGFRCVIDDSDWPAVSRLTLYAGTNGYVYFSTWVNGKSNPRTLHGFLMNPPTGMHVDHINGDKMDNRRSNLRVVTPSLNQLNRKSLNANNRSGIRGVQHVPRLSRVRPWRAQITVNRVNIHLGMFSTEGDAIAARRAAERSYFSEEAP